MSTIAPLVRALKEAHTYTDAHNRPTTQQRTTHHRTDTPVRNTATHNTYKHSHHTQETKSKNLTISTVPELLSERHKRVQPSLSTIEWGWVAHGAGVRVCTGVWSVRQCANSAHCLNESQCRPGATSGGDVCQCVVPAGAAQPPYGIQSANDGMLSDPL